MQLSLSVRIAESFLSKEHAVLNLEQLARLAREAGYAALCMRASQVGVHSARDDWQRAAELLRREGLAVSMITGDFDTVYNNDQGPRALRRIGPYLDLAATLGARLIRVALKSSADIVWAQRAADEAAERQLQLVHQCHTLSLFETLASIEATLRAIDRPNFGLIYEPANLEICGQPHTGAALERLAPWIMNVYLQNQTMRAADTISPETVTLETWCRGPVSFDLRPIHDPGGIDFDQVLSGLQLIGYDGWVTVHQAAGATGPGESARLTAEYLRRRIGAQGVGFRAAD